LTPLVEIDPPFQIGITKPVVSALLSEIEKVRQTHFEDEEGKTKFPDADAIIQSWQLNSLTSAAREFEAVFKAEMRNAATYSVPKRAAFDTATMVGNARELIPVDLRSVLGVKAELELMAGGKAYAFGLFTAAGYHVCRAVEALLAEYHTMFCGQPTSNRMTMNDYISELEQIIEAGGSPVPDKRTVHNLKQVKDFSRNPLMHPRSVLEETDAYLLINESVAAMTCMSREMSDAECETQPSMFSASEDEKIGVALPSLE
tara:strand:- start:129 stop:905 length:777 start_codon:yes stop_codon:yes gene_type:complete